MPRKKQTVVEDVEEATVHTPNLEPLESTLDDVRVLLEARKALYQGASDRITEILASLQPKPRIGRPPKAK